MTAPQGLRTPQRSTYDMFDEGEEHINQNVFTPCTRLSRMMIESQSNGQGRIRTANFSLPVTNFNEKLSSVVREDNEEESSSHPNLDMVLSADKISMSKDNQVFSFSEDEDSDEGDLFSSSLCPMSSPGRIYTKNSIFDDEPIHSFFEEDTEEDEDKDDDETNSYLDPTDSWPSKIHCNNYNFLKDQFETNHDGEGVSDEEDDTENRPPRFWIANKVEKKTRRTLPLKEDNSAHERLLLREIRFEDYLSDDEIHTKKKSLLGDGKSQKMRYMRTLSPPRYAKRKGKELVENTMPLSTVVF
ncbi:hypothetical protein EDC94DRAFT_656958 [Helicostylum pulchrum]|nr:hypothetical protein EDC94DRAFT_656958 [Helicostylum pulchrum]